MKCLIGLAVVLSTAAIGCIQGPNYDPHPAIPPSQRVGAPRSSDSSRQFFDSLAAERRRDSVRVVTSTANRRTIDDAGLAAAAWMEIIPYSALVGLVDQVIYNRDVQFAVARMNEYRANVGIAVRVTAAERDAQWLGEHQSGRKRRVSRNVVQCGATDRRSRLGARLLGSCAARSASRERGPRGARCWSPCGRAVARR